MVRGGEFYPRWASNFYFGYGYPIFNYYAPFSYYVGLLFDLFPLVNPVSATKIIFILSILLGGYGIFGYVNLLWGQSAAYVATAIFVYAPYIQYIDPHARGVSPESFALGLFPLTLWALEALRQQPTGRRFITAGLAITALVVSHNIMTMLFGGVLLGWVLWQQLPPFIGQEKTAPKPFLPLYAYLLGILGSSFFWLPVALERNEVNLNTLVGPEGSHFAYSSHFLSLSTLLSPTQWLDWGATEPFYIFNLGIAPWLFGFSGIAFLVWAIAKKPQPLAQSETVWQASFWALTAVGLIWLMLPSSNFLWNNIPVLPFIQFPWRLLGPVAAILAILAGFSTHMLSSIYTSATTAITTSAITLTLLFAIPLTQPQPWPSEFGETTISAVATQENRGRWLGTTSTADFVPATVDVVPGFQSQLLDALKSNETPDRVNYASLPANVEVEQQQIRPLYTRYIVSSPDPFALRLFLFDFPGWEVRIDGQTADSELGLPEGFIVIPTPPGTHTIEVEFVNTPPRTYGWWLTSLAVIALVGGGFWLTKRDNHLVQHNTTAKAYPINRWLWSIVTIITMVTVLQGQWFHYESNGTAVEIAQHPHNANFGNQLSLIGADISTAKPDAGDTLFTTFYWQRTSALEINYQVFVHLFAPDGTLVAQSDKLNPGDFPTTRWPADKYVRDPHQLHLPADLPAGTYELRVGLWVQDEGWRLPLLDENSTQIGDGYSVQHIEIR